MRFDRQVRAQHHRQQLTDTQLQREPPGESPFPATEIRLGFAWESERFAMKKQFKGFGKIMIKKLLVAMTALAVCGFAGAQELDIPKDDDVVAERGGVPVTVGQLLAKLRIGGPKQARKGYFADGNKTATLIDGQLLTHQIAAEARANGLDKDPQIQREIEAEIAELLSRRQIERHMESLQEPNFEELARERYIAKKAEYIQEETADVRHILILTSDKTEEEAKAKADKAYAQLKDGVNFDAIWMEYSEDPNRAANGWVRKVSREGFDMAFVDATEKLQNIGDISEPVKSQFGYHIIRLEKRTPARQRTFDEMKVALIDQARQEFRMAARDAYLASFSVKPLTVNEEVVQKLHNIEEP